MVSLTRTYNGWFRFAGNPQQIQTLSKLTLRFQQQQLSTGQTFNDVHSLKLFNMFPNHCQGYLQKCTLFACKIFSKLGQISECWYFKPTLWYISNFWVQGQHGLQANGSCWQGQGLCLDLWQVRIVENFLKMLSETVWKWSKRRNKFTNQQRDWRQRLSHLWHLLRPGLGSFLPLLLEQLSHCKYKKPQGICILIPVCVFHPSSSLSLCVSCTIPVCISK